MFFADNDCLFADRHLQSVVVSADVLNFLNLLLYRNRHDKLRFLSTIRKCFHKSFESFFFDAKIYTDHILLVAVLPFCKSVAIQNT